MWPTRGTLPPTKSHSWCGKHKAKSPTLLMKGRYNFGCTGVQAFRTKSILYTIVVRLWPFKCLVSSMEYKWLDDNKVIKNYLGKLLIWDL